MEAVDDHGSVLRLGGRKQRIVLAALALRDEVVPADRLMTLLWPDDQPARPEATLHVYISTLRKVLGLGSSDAARATIVRQPPGYRLVLPPGALDLARFTDLVREGRQAKSPAEALDRWDAAAALWRGALLADLADEPFVQVAAVRLAEQRREAILASFQAMLDLGRCAEVVTALEELAVDEPSDERVWALLMTALYRSGRQVGAASTFSRAREALLDAAGVDPSPALRDLQERILRHDPTLGAGPAATSPARVLPAPGRAQWSTLGQALVGRDKVISAVVDQLGPGATVTVCGPAGAGKSAIAAAVASRRVEAGGAVAWVSLDDRVRVGDATASIGSLVDAALASVTAGVTELLVVLDGGDDQAVDVREFVAESTHRVILSRRAPLSIDDEIVVEVSALEPGAARDLFLQRAARAQDPGSAPPSRELVDQICAAVDCLPLGVELAAAQLRSMSAADLSAWLAGQVHRISDPDRDGPTRHSSLGAAFAGAVASLGPLHLDDLVRLTVFRGGWDLEAHRTVLGSDSVARLDALVRAGLVWPDRSGVRFRYRIPSAVRDLVLDGREVDTDTRRAHAIHFAGEARRWRAQRHGYEARKAAAALAADEANVSVALMAALELDDDLAATVGVAIGSLFYTPARLPWLDERLAELVSRGAGNDQDRPRLRVMWGHTRYLRGHEDQAAQLFRSAVDELELTDDLAIRARTVLAQIAADHGDMDAIDLICDAVSAGERSGRPELLTQALDAAILIAIMLGELTRARAWAADKLELEVARRDDFGRAFTTLRLAWIAYLSHDDSEAERMAGEAIDLARQVGAQIVDTYATAILGQSLIDRDPAASLTPLVSSALTLIDEGVPLDVADAVLAVAASCARGGDDVVAIRLAAFADRCFADANIVRPAYLRRLDAAVRTAWERLEPDAALRAGRVGRMLCAEDVRVTLVALHRTFDRGS